MAITAELLRQHVHYDPETGHFVRLVPCGYRNMHHAGVRIGGINPNGYVLVQTCGERHKAHRLAWLYVHGHWPAGDIDHINGVRHDNRLLNLRVVTRQTNTQNARKARRQSKSGYLGVSPVQRSGGRIKWVAQIASAGKKLSLGYYESPELAYGAYVAAKRLLHEGNTL